MVYFSRKGSWKPLFCKALSTRSLLSRTALSGSPTIKNMVRSSCECISLALTSKNTGMAAMPLTAEVCMVVNMLTDGVTG